VSSEAELVPVGRVGRPHGLGGAFLVEGASDDERRFEVGGTLHVDGVAARILESYRAGNRRALRLEQPAARGAELAVRRDELPPPEPDHYYAFQLVALDVFDGERLLGRVRDVLPGAANDNLVLDTGVLVPLVEDAVRAIDLEAGRIDVVPGFLGAD
jgi:16S rRNA processing protein RimM